MKLKTRSLGFLVVLFFFSTQCIAQYNIKQYLITARQALSENKPELALEKMDVVIRSGNGTYEAFFFRGLSQYLLNNYPSAVADFTDCLAKNPLYSEAYHYRGKSYFSLNRPELAIQDFEEAEKIDISNAQLFADKAFCHLFLKQFDKALEYATKAEKIGGVTEAVLVGKGAAYNGLKDYDNALDYFSRAIAKNPFNADHFTRRGMVKHEMKRFDEAISDFDRSLKVQPSNPFGLFNKAITYADQDCFKESMVYLDSLVLVDPSNSLAYYNRAIVKTKQNRFKEAIADYDKALKLSPDNIQVLFNRGRLFHQLKNLKAAIADYNRTIQLYPYHVEAFYNRSYAKGEMGDFKGAKQDMDLSKNISLINHMKSDADLQKDAVLLEKLSEFNVSFEMVDKRIVEQQEEALSDEANAQFYFYSSAKDLKGQIISANVEEYNRSKNKNLRILKSDSFPCPEGELLNIKISALLCKGAFTEAENLIVQKINIDTADVTMLVTLAQVNKELSDNEDDQKQKDQRLKNALALFDRAITLAPKIEYLFFDRALIYAKLNDYNKALKDLEKSIKLNDQFGEAFLYKGMLLTFLKQKDAACDNFVRAESLGIKDAAVAIKRFCR